MESLSFIAFIIGFSVMFSVITFSLRKFESVIDSGSVYVVIAISIFLGTVGVFFVSMNVYGINIIIYSVSAASMNVLIKMIPFKIFKGISKDFNAMFYGIVAGSTYGGIIGVVVTYSYMINNQISILGMLVAIAATLDFVLVNASSGYAVGKGYYLKDRLHGVTQGILYELPLYFVIYFFQTTRDTTFLILIFAYSVGLYHVVYHRLIYYIPKKQRKKLLASN